MKYEILNENDAIIAQTKTRWLAERLIEGIKAGDGLTSQLGSWAIREKQPKALREEVRSLWERVNTSLTRERMYYCNGQGTASELTINVLFDTNQFLLNTLDDIDGRSHLSFPPWTCQQCGAQIGYLGRFFQVFLGCFIVATCRRQK